MKNENEGMKKKMRDWDKKGLSDKKRRWSKKWSKKEDGEGDGDGDGDGKKDDKKRWKKKRGWDKEKKIIMEKK